MKENSNERAEPVAGEPNFCENCAMDLLTCDCVVKRPVHLETATDPDCAAPRVWEGDKPHGANYAGWRREVIAAQPAADNAPKAPSAGSVAVALPIPFLIDRTHKNRAFVTLGFMTEQECDAFIKATRTDGLFSSLLAVSMGGAKS